MSYLSIYKKKFIHPFIWKKIFLITYDLLLRKNIKYIVTKSSFIPYLLTKKKYFIWKGNRWQGVWITPWAVGHKFGEFIWTRRLAIYKAKQKRKKLMKKNKKKKAVTILKKKKKKFLFKARTLTKPKFYQAVEKKYFKYPTKNK